MLVGETASHSLPLFPSLSHVRRDVKGAGDYRIGFYSSLINEVSLVSLPGAYIIVFLSKLFYVESGESAWFINSLTKKTKRE
jgi:hypothetical protein